MVLCDLTDAKNCVFHGKRGEGGGRGGREEGGRGESNELNLSNGKYIFVGAERILFFFFYFFFHNSEKSSLSKFYPLSLYLNSTFERHFTLYLQI